MTPSARIIADSISRYGDRLTTMEVTMHRFVLAEFNTHRVFSRNSASSRAIPVERRMAAVLTECAVPVEWGMNRPGMQATELLPPEQEEAAKSIWKKAATTAVLLAQDLRDLGVHKQITNRLLEPFLWHTVIVSSTEWENFFVQRCSPLAQPEIRVVAEAMYKALSESTPTRLDFDEWHLPYVQDDEKDLSPYEKRQLSVARCARVSYLTHDGVRDAEKDKELYRRLISARPPHASPFEHVARPRSCEDADHKGNFEGWVQLRHDEGIGV